MIIDALTVTCFVLLLLLLVHLYHTEANSRKIVIHRSAIGYRASLICEDNKTIEVGAGITIEAALGDLIIRNPRRFSHFAVSYSESGAAFYFRTAKDAAEAARKNRETEADLLSRESR